MGPKLQSEGGSSCDEDAALEEGEEEGGSICRSSALSTSPTSFVVPPVANFFLPSPSFLPSAPPRSAEGGRGDDGGQIEGALTAEGGGGMGKEKVLTISDLHRSKG